MGRQEILMLNRSDVVTQAWVGPSGHKIFAETGDKDDSTLVDGIFLCKDSKTGKWTMRCSAFGHVSRQVWLGGMTELT